MENFSTQSQPHNPLFEESFSFSSFDFNGTFSDDDEDDEEYIEIALQQNQEEIVEPHNSTTNNHDHIKYDNLEVVRVSISSSVTSFPGFSSSTNYSSSNSSIITETVPSSYVLCVKNQRNNSRGFKTLNRLIGALFSTIKLKRTSSSSSLLGNTSKSSAKVNGGARKLLIKFRSIKVMSMIVSFVKPKQRQVIVNNIAIRGEIKQPKSCPASVKASPIHQNGNRDHKICGGDNCVQAAIAHCKQSFARNQIPNSFNVGSGQI